jgi:hypothetical protein
MRDDRDNARDGVNEESGIVPTGTMTKLQTIIAEIDMLKTKINLLEYEVLKVIRKSCHNCIWYCDKLCTKWKAQPPDDFMDHGCDEYKFNDVPF